MLGTIPDQADLTNLKQLLQLCSMLCWQHSFQNAQMTHTEEKAAPVTKRWCHCRQPCRRLPADTAVSSLPKQSNASPHNTAQNLAYISASVPGVPHQICHPLRIFGLVWISICTSCLYAKTQKSRRQSWKRLGFSPNLTPT